MKPVSIELTVKEFSRETWLDFEALFGKHKGVRGGCWCTFHLCTSAQYDKMAKDERKEFQKGLADQGISPGIIVYDEDTPVAWCQVGFAERFPRYERMRAYRELNHLRSCYPAGALLVYSWINIGAAKAYRNLR